MMIEICMRLTMKMLRDNADSHLPTAACFLYIYINMYTHRFPVSKFGLLLLICDAVAGWICPRTLPCSHRSSQSLQAYARITVRGIQASAANHDELGATRLFSRGLVSKAVFLLPLFFPRKAVAESPSIQELLLCGATCRGNDTPEDVKRALEINIKERERKAAAARAAEEQVILKASETRDKYKQLQADEAENFEKSDLGKLLKKRTKDNAEKNEASIREKYCVRNCKFEKALNREPRSSKEFLCQECQLEFGVIPGSEKYLKNKKTDGEDEEKEM